MAVRVITALVGGYAASAAVATLLARLLPGDRADATTWGMLSSFLIYAIVALWCFHEPRLMRVGGAVWGSALVGFIVLRWLGVRS